MFDNIIKFIITFLFTFLLTPISYSEEKIGLVLGGGGALGLAHIGVIRALEESKIPIHCITGTSMGAIVGALYASGKNSDQIESILQQINWDDLFNDSSKRTDIPFRRKIDDRSFLGTTKISFKDGNLQIPTGAIAGQKIDLLFTKLFQDSYSTASFDDLPIPFRAIGADVETGQQVVLGKGNLARAARASMSVPGVFAPVEIDGKLLVDGGIANNLPVEEAKNLGATKLIVVNLPADFLKRDKLTNAFSIAGQVLSFLLDQNARIQITKMSKNDILIEPILTGYTPTDFKESVSLIKAGYSSASTQIDRLKQLSVTANRYVEWRSNFSNLNNGKGLINEIRLVNNTNQSDDEILSALTTDNNDQLSSSELEDKINQLYNSLLYSQIRYDLSKDGDKTIAVVTADDKPWLSEYLRLGFTLSDNFDGDSVYNLGANYRWTDLNQSGAEFEVDGRIGITQKIGYEYFQPLYSKSPIFLVSTGELLNENLNLFRDDEAIARYQRSTDSITLAFGSFISNHSEIRVGAQAGNGIFERKIGDPQLPDVDFHTRSGFAQFTFDSLDSSDFPRAGSRFDSKYSRYSQTLGGSDEFQTISSNAFKPFNFGRNVVGVGYSTTRSLDALPVYGTFLNGGFLNFSGYQRNELLNSGNVIGRLIYYRNIFGESAGLLTSPIYAGLSLEAGKFYRQTQDDSTLFGSSIFLGADTPIIPVYLGVGFSQQGEMAAYFTLDRPF